MNLDKLSEQDRIRNMRVVIATAAMFLREDDIRLLAYTFQNQSYEEIARCFDAVAGTEADRPLVRVRAVFKDAPFPSYATYILAMLIHGYKETGGALTPEQVAAALAEVGIKSEPNDWAGIEKRGTVEAISHFLFSKVGPALARALPYIGGVLGTELGPAGTATGYELGAAARDYLLPEAKVK